jgi:hypothetical protein
MLLAGGSSFGADQPAANKAADQKHTTNKPVAPEGAKAQTTTAAEKSTKTHLPAGFGKVNLTAEQHQRAKAVMEKYAGQIKQLETQIHELRMKREGELNALLSDTQKKSLAEAKTNSQKVKEEKKAVAGKMPALRGRFHIDPKALATFKEKQAEKKEQQAEKQQESKQSKKDKSEKSKDSSEKPKDQTTAPEKK